MTRANTLFDLDRFFQFDDGCWMWTGFRNKQGYGKIKIKAKMYSGHRAMYEYFYGVNPGQMDVCHTCDNPPCVRPSHLFLGTHSDNMRDMISKKRRNFNGERGPAAKISDQQALQIRSDLRAASKIAPEYGVTKGTIAKIKSRRTFRHLP